MVSFRRVSLQAENDRLKAVPQIFVDGRAASL